MATQEQHFNGCFVDINLLNIFEEEENSISWQFIEWLINCLELAAKFEENVLPFINEREEEMADWWEQFQVFLSSSSCSFWHQLWNKILKLIATSAITVFFLLKNVQQINNVYKTLVKMLFLGHQAALKCYF